jgi:precorrin-6B methylase 2
VALCILLGVSGYLQAQAKKQPKPFKPEVGRPGKDVMWVPTSQELVNMMLDMAKVTPQDYVIDLGSGDGRIVITAAKRGVRALGIEYDPDLVELSKVNAAKEGVSDKATFMKADLFETDLSRATVITMFLMSNINLELRPTLLELKPGTRIVSDTFNMGSWQADEISKVSEGCKGYCKALLWIVPAKAKGRWQFSGGELTLNQKFQMLSGTLTLNGKRAPVSDAKMVADQITFGAGSTVYTGRLTGNVIEGTATAGGSSVPWKATRADK